MFYFGILLSPCFLRQHRCWASFIFLFEVSQDCNPSCCWDNRKTAHEMCCSPTAVLPLTSAGLLWASHLLCSASQCKQHVPQRLLVWLVLITSLAINVCSSSNSCSDVSPGAFMLVQATRLYAQDAGCYLLSSASCQAQGWASHKQGDT